MTCPRCRDSRVLYRNEETTVVEHPKSEWVDGEHRMTLVSEEVVIGGVDICNVCVGLAEEEYQAELERRARAEFFEVLELKVVK
jgi:hypothetical protein